MLIQHRTFTTFCRSLLNTETSRYLLVPRRARKVHSKDDHFILKEEKEIDGAAWGRRCKFYSIPSFRCYRIRANLNSAEDSRGKPEGPNIIPGTRGGRHVWDLTCIHFPNRRVNVKNTARVFSRREGKKYRRDENIGGAGTAVPLHRIRLPVFSSTSTDDPLNSTRPFPPSTPEILSYIWVSYFWYLFSCLQDITQSVIRWFAVKLLGVAKMIFFRVLWFDRAF